MTATDFDVFIDTAWNDHGDQPQVVADRLEQSRGVIKTAVDLVRFTALASHVYGEHLGQWQQGIALLESLRASPAAAGPAAAGPAADDSTVVRAVATLRYAMGDATALDELNPEARCTALAFAAAALIGRHESERGLAAYATAVWLADAGLPAGSPAFRALAVGGNNLAAELEGKVDRTAAETSGMVEAAQSALRFWRIAGTWLQEERAQYRLTRSLLHAGANAEAVLSARDCLHVCTRNDAPPLELFYAHVAVALAQRAVGDVTGNALSRTAALAAYAGVADCERRWCATELRELSAADAAMP